MPPQEPSVVVTRPLGAEVGADADEDAPVDAGWDAAPVPDDDAGAPEEGEAEAELPHFPKPAWQPTPQ